MILCCYSMARIFKHVKVNFDVDAFFFFVDADFIMDIYEISAHPILTADYQYVLYLPFLFYPFPFNISTTEGARDQTTCQKVGLPLSVGSLRTSRESSVGSNSSSSSIQQPKRERERERDSVNDARSGRRTIPKIFQR